MNEILNITVKNENITLTKTFQQKTLEERTAVFGGNLNLDGELDFGEPLGGEVW